MGFPLLSVTTFLPLIGALLIILVRSATAPAELAERGRGPASGARSLDEDRRSANRVILTGLLVSAATFIAALWVFIDYDTAAGGYQLVEDAQWFAGIRYKLGVDGLSVTLILLTAFMMPICFIASLDRVTHRATEYVVAFLVLETFMIGVFCALDLVLFYIFFEAGLIPMFIIIAVWGGKASEERTARENAEYASFKFFLYTLLGSLFMLAAVVYMYLEAGTSDIEVLETFAFSSEAQIWLFLAFFASFAVKLPMWPVHTWLPDAHVQAPTAGSVVLAAILLKMGGYGFLRFSLPMFPEASVFFQVPIFILSGIAIVYASLVAWRQTDMKKLIAYSSVAHMGFVTLGIFSFTEVGIQGAVFQMLSHGLISGALFLLVGVCYERTHTLRIADYGGLVNQMPLFAAVFLLFTMANVGLPGTSGFVGEMMTMVGGFQAASWAAFIAAIGVIFSAVYMLTLYRETTLGMGPANGYAFGDLTGTEIASLAPLVFFTLLFGLKPGFIFDVTEGSAERILALLAGG